MATFTPVIVAREEMFDNSKNPRSNLAQVLYICYLINFRKKTVLTLFNLGSKTNTVHLTFAKESGFLIRPTDVKIQKVDGSTLDTYGIVVAAFLMTNKANQVRFFTKTFLVANISPKVVYGMLFLILSSADIDFLDRKLR